MSFSAPETHKKPKAKCLSLAVGPPPPVERLTSIFLQCLSVIVSKRVKIQNKTEGAIPS